MQPRLDPNKALAELCRRSFFRFVQEFWAIVIPEEPIYNWHIPYLCDELQELIEAVVRRDPKLYDLIINIPPGTTKTTICTVMLPAWAWTLDPTLRGLTASYAAGLSTAHSVLSRDIVRSDKYRRLFPEVRIKKDEDNKTHYKTEANGERMATSVGGAATGFHAHFIVVDDPINPKEAESEADRIAANSFMDRTLSTRKVNKSLTPTILVMQRLHQNDPTGNWLDKRTNIKHICLPGELVYSNKTKSYNVKPDYLKDLYVDGLLDPERLNREELAELRESLGSYGYAGQIGQTPTPAEGAIWGNWIIPIRTDLIPKLAKKAKDWDLAYTKDDKNSASAYVEAGLSGGNMYITGAGYAYKEFPELINWMTLLGGPHNIEAKASGKSAKQTLKGRGIAAIEVQVDGGGDKIGRTRLATPYAEAGFVYCDEKILPLLLHDEKQGILTFPNNGTDLNDALVQSINRLLKRKRTKLGDSNVNR